MSTQQTEETYTATQLNLAKLTKESSATYQIRLWSQRSTKVKTGHILLRSPPWFGNETKNQLVSCTNPAASWSLYASVWEATQRRNNVTLTPIPQKSTLSYNPAKLRNTVAYWNTVDRSNWLRYVHQVTLLFLLSKSTRCPNCTGSKIDESPELGCCCR